MKMGVVMDSQVSLDYIVENSDYTKKLASALDTDSTPVKKQIFELLSALSLYSVDGRNRALETLRHYKGQKNQRYQFKFILDELRGTDALEYKTILVAFINCIIIAESSSLKERVRTRNEFLGLKVLEVFSQLRKECEEGSHPDLATQLDLFEEQRTSDESQSFGPEGVDLSSHMDVFFAIFRRVAETPLETPFLSILQHLLRVDPSHNLSDLVWETAETLVHRATLLENHQDSGRLLRSFSGGFIRCHCSCHYRNDESGDPGRKLVGCRNSRPTDLSLRSDASSGILSPSKPPPTPIGLQNHSFDSASTKQIQECPKAPATPPNEFNTSARETKVDVNSDQHSSSIEHTTAPVPQLPPPPPPPPFLHHAGQQTLPNGIPAPPPLPGGPTSISSPLTVSKEVVLPQQNTPLPKNKMKSLNWSKISAAKVWGRDNLWSRVAQDHMESSNDLDFDAMEKLFCQPQMNSCVTQMSSRQDTRDIPDGVENKKKDAQEINLLDGKRSLNVNIFLKQFRSSHEEIFRIVENGTHEELGAERLRGLLSILPEPDEVEMLKTFDGEKCRLGKAEKFLLKLIQVPCYKLRIESMLLKEEFRESQDFLETSVERVRFAAREIQSCAELHEILYMILVAGNFLNAGGYAGNAAGFKMLSLMKLTEIRANKPSVTLVHYVAEQAAKKNPPLLKFLDELRNLEEASKISMDTLQADANSLIQRVKHVAAQVDSSDSQIKTQMQDFLKFAMCKVETIQKEINDLQKVRQQLGDFLCEDNIKLEDCFKVFHSFCTRFKVAIQENEKRKHQEKMAETRRKQREEQLASKRRSIELGETNGNGVQNPDDNIMDQFIGDIRSGFPVKRFGELGCVRNRVRNEDSTDNVGNEDAPELLVIESGFKSTTDVQKDIDPVNGATVYGINVDTIAKNSGSAIPVKKRLRHSDEHGCHLIGYLRNSSESENVNRRSWGSADGGSLDRIPQRRSGRKKRIEVTTNESHERERPVSPTCVKAAHPEKAVSMEWNSKQQLKAKINDWMVQNEREQERERILSKKFVSERRKRINETAKCFEASKVTKDEAHSWNNSNSLDSLVENPLSVDKAPHVHEFHNIETEVKYQGIIPHNMKSSHKNNDTQSYDLQDMGQDENCSLQSTEFDVSENYRSVKNIRKIFDSDHPKNTLNRESPSIFESPNSFRKILRTKDYHSLRDPESKKKQFSPQTQDDIRVNYKKSPVAVSCDEENSQSSSHQNFVDIVNQQKPFQEVTSLKRASVDDKCFTKDEDDLQESNFDRHSVARKTQRRMKLRQMRIEAEETMNFTKLSKPSQLGKDIKNEKLTSQTSPTELPKNHELKNVSHPINDSFVRNPIVSNKKPNLSGNQSVGIEDFNQLLSLSDSPSLENGAISSAGDTPALSSLDHVKEGNDKETWLVFQDERSSVSDISSRNSAMQKGNTTYFEKCPSAEENISRAFQEGGLTTETAIPIAVGKNIKSRSSLDMGEDKQSGYEDLGSFDTKGNRSSRSRKSRLARRINSLSLKSPTLATQETPLPDPHIQVKESLCLNAVSIKDSEIHLNDNCIKNERELEVETREQPSLPVDIQTCKDATEKDDQKVCGNIDSNFEIREEKGFYNLVDRNTTQHDHWTMLNTEKLAPSDTQLSGEEKAIENATSKVSSQHKSFREHHSEVLNEEKKARTYSDIQIPRFTPKTGIQSSGKSPIGGQTGSFTVQGKENQPLRKETKGQNKSTTSSQKSSFRNANASSQTSSPRNSKRAPTPKEIHITQEVKTSKRFKSPAVHIPQASTVSSLATVVKYNDLKTKDGANGTKTIPVILTDRSSCKESPGSTRKVQFKESTRTKNTGGTAAKILPHLSTGRGKFAVQGGLKRGAQLPGKELKTSKDVDGKTGEKTKRHLSYTSKISLHNSVEIKDKSASNRKQRGIPTKLSSLPSS